MPFHFDDLDVVSEVFGIGLCFDRSLLYTLQGSKLPRGNSKLTTVKLLSRVSTGIFNRDQYMYPAVTVAIRGNKPF